MSKSEPWSFFIALFVWFASFFSRSASSVSKSILSLAWREIAVTSSSPSQTVFVMRLVLLPPNQKEIYPPIGMYCYSASHHRSFASLLCYNRSMHSYPSNSRSWLSSFGSERERPGKERKGWSITVHELSGSPVALASIVTPSVACPGSDWVSRSNPGAWLILRLGDGTWKPWGRLEAWQERGSSDGLGYRFELLPDMSAIAAGILLVELTLSTSKGGKFVINMGSNGNGRSTPGTSTSPICSPQSSGDYRHMWPFATYRGFVISSTVEGEGKISQPVVEVGVQHVGCSEDATIFMALSATIDMSMDACKLFSHKLRKELCPPQQDFI